MCFSLILRHLSYDGGSYFSYILRSQLYIHAAQVQHLYKGFSNFFIANNYKSSLELVSSQQLGTQNTCYMYFLKRL